MLEIRVVYEMPKGGGGGFGHVGDIGHPGALIGIILVVVVVAAISAAAESKKKRLEDENDEFTGPNMIIDGCRDCGTFWFDEDEMKIVKQSLSIKGTTKEELSASQKAEKADMEELHLAAKREAAMLGASCMHFEERGMPPALEQCKRPKHRETEYCYMHQPK